MKYAFTHGKLLAANEGISVPGGHMAGSVAVAAHSIPEALAQLDAAEAQGVDLIKLIVVADAPIVNIASVIASTRISASARELKIFFMLDFLSVRIKFVPRG